MCLIAWNWQPDSATPLLLLANRDEFYARPALPLHWWDNEPVLAGRDLQAGGTWLGVSRSGRMAALTNHRLPVNDSDTRPSRGNLVADFLRGDMDAGSYLEALTWHADDYNPFNLLVLDGQRFMGLESRSKRVLDVPLGLGAVSNADFDTPWPKLIRLKAGLQAQLRRGRLETSDLLPLLQDMALPMDAELPSTGIPLALERMLSAAFVTSQHYGTRACSIVTLNRKQCSFFEHSCGEHGMLAQTQQFFTL
jgi:uncharacterized protein with NRDE domain